MDVSRPCVGSYIQVVDVSHPYWVLRQAVGVSRPLWVLKQVVDVYPLSTGLIIGLGLTTRRTLRSIGGRRRDYGYSTNAANPK